MSHKSLEHKRKGVFYTPSLMVDYAYEQIEKVFGEDWKERYIVWDCSCGQGALTADYSFKRLYQSTLDQVDIDYLIENKINPESTKFQFDFLNDGLDKLPADLVTSLRNKEPIIFLNNPPYQRSGNDMTRMTGIGNDTGGVSLTKTREQMHKLGMGRSSTDLQNQFLFKMKSCLKNNPDGHMVWIGSGALIQLEHSEKIRSYVLSKMSVEHLAMFSGEFFESVSKDMQVLLYIVKASNEDEVRSFFELPIIRKKKDKLIVDKQWVVYHVNDKSKRIKTWLQEPYKEVEKTLDRDDRTLYLNNALSGGNGPGTARKTSKDVVGCVSITSSDPQHHRQANLFSDQSGINGFAIFRGESFDRACFHQAVRFSIPCVLENAKNLIMRPDMDNPIYNQSVVDSYVFSIFTPGVALSSMRNFKSVSGNVYDVQNQFFWMHPDEVRQLAIDNQIDSVVSDVDSYGQERYMTSLLNEAVPYLSKPFKDLYDYCIHLTKLSFLKRKEMIASHPELHLNAWDAGWYQLKFILKEHYPKEWKHFQTLYKACKKEFESRVYQLGMLYTPTIRPKVASEQQDV